MAVVVVIVTFVVVVVAFVLMVVAFVVVVAVVVMAVVWRLWLRCLWLWRGVMAVVMAVVVVAFVAMAVVVMAMVNYGELLGAVWPFDAAFRVRTINSTICRTDCGAAVVRRATIT